MIAQKTANRKSPPQLRKGDIILPSPDEIAAMGLLTNGNQAVTANPALSPPATSQRGKEVAPPLAPAEDKALSQDEAPAVELNFKLDKDCPYQAEDGGILDCWRDLYGAEWIYVTGHDAWYRTQRSHWRKDDQLFIYKQIQALMDALNRQARVELIEAYAAQAAIDDDAPEWLVNQLEAAVGHAKAWIKATRRTNGRVASIAGMAQAQRAVPAGKLDHGNVLNLKNGTLDLDTLTLRPHDPADYLTYCLQYAYDPAFRAERFERFVAEVIGDYVKGRWKPDDELREVFQELLGYSLTNDTRHEVMAWLSGEGGNGKTVAITVIHGLLGELARNVDFQTLGLPGNYELAEVNGKRVIFSTEAERGGRVAEGYVKRIVSGETINTRAIYGTPFEFESQAKIWWAMNDLPTIKDTSNAIWRRLKLIPFNRTFTDQDKDPDLKDKLLAELPGILNYALDGLRRLREQSNFTRSEAIERAVGEYKKASNPVAQWRAERTVALPEGEWRLSADLYEDYKQWSEETGHEGIFKATNFGRELKRLKVAAKDGVRVGKHTGNGYAIRLKTPADEAAEEVERQAQAEKQGLGF